MLQKDTHYLAQEAKHDALSIARARHQCVRLPVRAVGRSPGHAGLVRVLADILSRGRRPLPSLGGATEDQPENQRQYRQRRLCDLLVSVGHDRAPEDDHRDPYHDHRRPKFGESGTEPEGGILDHRSASPAVSPNGLGKRHVCSMSLWPDN